MEKQFEFKTEELESQLEKCREKGITELSVHDTGFSRDKKKILSLLKKIASSAPELFVSVKIEPSVLDMEIIRALSEVRSSVEMDFSLTEKGFDKKLFAKKCALLNNYGLVFGVNLYYALLPSDSLKAFKERLDFTLSQYPNHIDFPQTEKEILDNPDKNTDVSPKVSGNFSAQDIRLSRDIAFAARTFYSSGRAVPWFNSVLAALKIQGSAFFADFAEWQRVNNCDFKSGFVPESEKHENIEKMQLLFLNIKLEEKRKNPLLPVVNDIVHINGAFSRLVAEGEKSVLQTEYNPDDLLGPESMDLSSFVNDVCMSPSSVSIFFNSDGEPDYKIL